MAPREQDNISLIEGMQISSCRALLNVNKVKIEYLLNT